MRTVTVTGTTLFHVAAALLGDATQWITIAMLNGMTDPVITTPVTLTLPDADTNYTGGGLPPQ